MANEDVDPETRLKRVIASFPPGVVFFERRPFSAASTKKFENFGVSCTNRRDLAVRASQTLGLVHLSSERNMGKITCDAGFSGLAAELTDLS